MLRRKKKRKERGIKYWGIDEILYRVAREGVSVEMSFESRPEVRKPVMWILEG